MFESLRPDHIIQGVARFYLATPFYLLSFLPLQNDWLWMESSMDIKDAICAFSVLFYDRLLRYRGDPRGYVTDHLWPRAAGI